MNNPDDQLQLQELASVIHRLETVLASLKQTSAHSVNDNANGSARGLLSHWQTRFTARAGETSDNLHHRLASELEQQLTRLHRGHHKLAQLHKVNGQKLRSFAVQLQLSGFSPPLAASFLNTLSQNDACHQDQLWQLLDYYQQALSACTEQGTQQLAHQHQLCSHLQLLIDELHFSGPVALELTKIRHQLQQPLDATLLPGICLRLLDLTIEGVRFERKSSRQFLTNLHQHLETVHHNAAITLSEEQSLCHARAHHGHHIAGELKAIGEHLFRQDNKQLKADIELRMRSINQILLQNERLQQREQALLQRMTAMEQQINGLKNETNNFKQQLSEQNDKLFVDSLTQIPNRAGMDQRLEIAYRQWLRTEKPLCLALLDIDYFKEINDKYGHLAGDKALRLIARTLRQSLRECDFVARFGGEEFMVLLSDVSPEHLDQPLQKLREQVKKIPFRFKEEPVTITISLGATLFKQGDSILSALERADQALYRAKHAGRDQIVMD